MTYYKRTIGKKAEVIAKQYLLSNSYQVIDQNYYERVGEIDIICMKRGEYHFVEVKSRSILNNYSQVYPEEVVDDQKVHKMEATAKTYLVKQGLVPEDILWHLDLITIVFNYKTHNARLKFYPDIIY